MDYNATLTAQNLGLLPNDYNFLMGLMGLFIGVFFFFFLIQALISIARGY